MEVQITTLLLLCFVLQLIVAIAALGGVFLGGWLVYRTKRDQPLVGELREPTGSAVTLDDEFGGRTTGEEPNDAEDWGGELMENLTRRAEQRIAKEYEQRS